MGRAPCCDKANVKRGPWSPEEDNKLKEFIDKYGTGGNWIALPHKAGLKRCGKSCRLRWLNYLRPNIKHGEFTPEEDRIICSLFASIGSRWSIIASQLPGRTDNDIKNYWNTKLKKKLLGILPANKRKPNQQQQQQQQQQDHQLFQASIASTSAQNSSSLVNFDPSTTKTLLEGLQPLPISQEIINSSYPLLQPQMQQYRVKDSGSFLMFGGEPSCSSSDCSSTRVNYGKETEYNFGGGGGGGGGVEQMGFDDYGNGGLGIGHRINPSHGTGPWVGAPLESYYDVRELVCSNNGSICLNDPSIVTRSTGLKNQERVQYYY